MDTCPTTPFAEVAPEALTDVDSGDLWPIEGGRFVVRGSYWVLVDPLLGRVASRPHYLGRSPTPDGRWLVGGGAARLDPTPAPDGVRTAWVGGYGGSELAAWSETAAVVLATDPDWLSAGGAVDPDRSLRSAPLAGSLWVTHDDRWELAFVDLLDGRLLGGACADRPWFEKGPPVRWFAVYHPTAAEPAQWFLEVDAGGRVVASAPDGWWWWLDPATGDADLHDPSTPRPSIPTPDPWHPGHLAAVTDDGVPIVREGARCLALLGDAQFPFDCPPDDQRPPPAAPVPLPLPDLPAGAVAVLGIPLGGGLWRVRSEEALVALRPDGTPGCVLPDGDVRWSSDGRIVAVDGRQGLGTWQLDTCAAVVEPELRELPPLASVVHQGPPDGSALQGLGWCGTGMEQLLLRYRTHPGTGGRTRRAGCCGPRAAPWPGGVRGWAGQERSAPKPPRGRSTAGRGWWRGTWCAGTRSGRRRTRQAVGVGAIAGGAPQMRAGPIGASVLRRRYTRAPMHTSVSTVDQYWPGVKPRYRTSVTTGRR